MSAPLFSITIRFYDAPAFEYNDEVIPRRTFYHAHLIRGPYDVPANQTDIKDFHQKRIESPTITEWEDPLIPVQLMDPGEALAKLMVAVAEAVQAPAWRPEPHELR